MKVIKHTDCVYVAAESGKVVKYLDVKFKVAIMVNPVPIDRLVEVQDNMPTGQEE